MVGDRRPATGDRYPRDALVRVSGVAHGPLVAGAVTAYELEIVKGLPVTGWYTVQSGQRARRSASASTLIF